MFTHSCLAGELPVTDNTARPDSGTRYAAARPRQGSWRTANLADLHRSG